MIREPNPTDVYVGKRIKQLRKEIGVTLEELAPRIGVSYQQIQKYEKGQNRVSASRLFDIAGALDISVGAFFPAREEER